MNQPATAQIRDILIDLRKDMMQRITLILFIFGYILLNIAVLMRPFSITATLCSIVPQKCLLTEMPIVETCISKTRAIWKRGFTGCGAKVSNQYFLIFKGQKSDFIGR